MNRFFQHSFSRGTFSPIALLFLAVAMPIATVLAVTMSGRPADNLLHRSAPEELLRTESAVGMYLTAGSVGNQDFLEETIQNTKKYGGNALMFDVKGSAVFFDADLPMAEELGLERPQYDLANVLRIARENDLYTLARFVAVKDAGLTRTKPDTLIKHPDTGVPIGYEFVDPEHPDALEYNRQIICALARSGVDEINLDYIRFSTEQVQSLRVYSMEEKSRKVREFVRMARAAIDECGPRTRLGISTFAIIGWNYDMNVSTLGQDVISFAPYVDIISPMAYPATFAVGPYYRPGVDPVSRMYFLVWRTLEGYKEFLGAEHSHKLRPWIQGYNASKQDLEHQMKAVTDAGLCGFTVWSAGNYYYNSYAALPSFQPAEGCAQ